MGGLKITFNRPASRYDFEMLHADTGDLFLHFEVRRMDRVEVKFLG